MGLFFRMISNAKVTDTVNNTTLELQQDLARSTPKQCVTLTHSVRSVQMYYALKTKLESCTDTWLQVTNQCNFWIYHLIGSLEIVNA